MNNNPGFLPIFTLNQLADRVAMRIDYFDKLFNAENVWDSIIELCQTIEAEPRNISTVIVDAKKDNRIVIQGTNNPCNLAWLAALQRWYNKYNGGICRIIY